MEGIEKLRERVLKKCNGDPKKYDDLQRYAHKLSQVQSFPFSWDCSIYEDEEYRYDDEFIEEQLAPGKPCLHLIVDLCTHDSHDSFVDSLVSSYQVQLLEIWKMSAITHQMMMLIEAGIQLALQMKLLVIDNSLTLRYTSIFVV